MAIGDLESVPDCTDLYYLDTGMYDTEAYGSVYILDADRPAVVDTGIGTNHELLFDALDEVGIGEADLAYILPTHVHLDHAGGAGFLAEAYPNATVVTHEIGVPHLVDPSRLVAGTKAAVDDQWEFYAEPRPVPEDRIEGVEGGETIDLGDRELDVVAAPGHAPHQVMFHDTGDDVLFTGDAAGIWVPSERTVRQTTPPSQFDLEQCLDDASAIVERDPDVLCFGHFGPREFDERLMAGYKRTLVEWVEAVRQKREELDDDDAVVEYFRNHTDMVDVWGERKARDEERLNVKGVLSYLDYRAKQDE
ncbi:Glyoxylase, beta-lactamase superfamily II [Halogranum amylolyticum]|uniref:Glyoxylase, beta-lactamase superfamily II n=1 Tax=Halogranum amylolyticum TaxID=660520 RepID=A0A1H8TQJ5_9EURY|nr:MBL fold metallo-hydrolase [Halogranum amylolyticum]SEO93141.1 Glyoxylase, beta-lactamase superfamily II [Halogranum amylolyticum]